MSTSTTERDSAEMAPAPSLRGVSRRGCPLGRAGEQNRTPVNIGNIVNEIPYSLKFLLEQHTIRGLA